MSNEIYRTLLSIEQAFGIITGNLHDIIKEMRDVQTRFDNYVEVCKSICDRLEDIEKAKIKDKKGKKRNKK